MEHQKAIGYGFNSRRMFLHGIWNTCWAPMRHSNGRHGNEKHGETALFQTVYKNWQTAFELRKDMQRVIMLVQNARAAEIQALSLMNQ